MLEMLTGAGIMFVGVLLGYLIAVAAVKGAGRDS